MNQDSWKPRTLALITCWTMSSLTGWAEPVPSFSLEDLSPRSVRYGQMVSPEDYRLQISAYYFGSAG
ncbi:MAG: hypothetical protein GWQ05_11390 [Verrucomicrobiaceae bacterium]|nr:hypothetical protein [Verrucomicrobiales bacterium]MDF1784498.1 hypothetical protein [Verrucomicrobiales bacterium]NCF88671.1 hypothetical protein [Verrucomicrobiaceae bacterium]NCF91544.1 hypothetical protein [Verrucomicrobiaceae bacterium]